MDGRMTNEQIYAQGYGISGQVNHDLRMFSYRGEVIAIPAHHIMVELLEGQEVADINRVREIAELYKTERV